MRNFSAPHRSLTLLLLALFLWLFWPAQALAAALVRFIHAVPGVGTATVSVDTSSGSENFGSIGFGQVTPFKSLRAGRFRWTLTSGGKTLASGTSTVRNGPYDIAIVENAAKSGVQLGVYRNASAMRGMSLVRAIHAAPELGQPMFMVDSRTLANHMRYGTVSPYFSVTPGSHTFSAMKPWLMKPGDPTLIDVKGMRFVPGVAYTVFAIGTRGQMARVVRVVDRGAPLTRPMTFASMSDQSMSASGSMMVHAGDSLWSIARKLAGPGATGSKIADKVAALWRLNAHRLGTGDPNLIFAGQRLMLPS
jgi:nucleoid-associated protein YgaU